MKRGVEGFDLLPLRDRWSYGDFDGPAQWGIDGARGVSLADVAMALGSGEMVGLEGFGLST